MPEALYLFKLAKDLYPESYNVYDSLADANEKMGQLKNALKNYQKAYSLAGESKQNQNIRKNIERVTAKLNSNK